MKEYNLAERLYSLRTQKNITQKEIAAYLGIKQAAYSKYEVGETEPKIPTLIKLARYYETDLNNLIGYSPLSPYEKAVKHLKHIVPDAKIKKDNNTGKIFCTVSRNSEYYKIKATSTIAETEKDFIECVKLADRVAIEELQEFYNDKFVAYFNAYMLMRRTRFLEKVSKESGYNNMAISFESERKQVENFFKKIVEKDNKRKARSDKKDGE